MKKSVLYGILFLLCFCMYGMEDKIEGNAQKLEKLEQKIEKVGREQKLLTQCIQKEVKAFINERGHHTQAPYGLGKFCEELKKDHDFYSRNQPTVKNLGVWKNIDFSISYNGFLWELLTEFTFFKQEMYDPEGTCFSVEKNTLWYVLLLWVSSKQKDLFPVVVDGVTKLSHVSFVRKDSTQDYDDEYCATMSSPFVSDQDLLHFMREGDTKTPRIDVFQYSKGVAHTIAWGGANAFTRKKIRPQFQGVWFEKAKRRGLEYVVARISVPYDEWINPEKYLVDVEKSVLYGKLLLTFHEMCKTELEQKNFGPHILEKDKVKAIWRPQDKELTFEYYNLLAIK
jgi:hypothetical protein